jgi:catechol 2,3-dioxygenase-like lactoylglutathione lyase family enzyme
MPALRQAVPFFLVRDMDASLRFYVDGLGFEKTIQWEPEGVLRWCWLQRDETAIMLQVFWGDGAPSPPAERTGFGVTICVICDDAVAYWREITGRGIEAKRPFVGNGMWVTEVTDPDGYVLCFESVTDAEEETELAE